MISTMPKGYVPSGPRAGISGFGANLIGCAIPLRGAHRVGREAAILARTRMPVPTTQGHVDSGSPLKQQIRKQVVGAWDRSTGMEGDVSR